MTSSAILRFLVLGLPLASTSSALAQQTPPPLTIGVEARLVLVDLVVLNKSDAVVSGLKQEDFVVREDGKERPVVSFAAFTSGGPVATSLPAAPGETAPAAATPVQPSAASTVLFIDDNQLTPPDAARLLPILKAVVEVIAQQEGILAMVAPGSGVRLADEPAKNPAGFRAAIDKIIGQRVPDHSDFPISDAEAILADQGDETVVDRLASRFVYLNPSVNSGGHEAYRFALAQGRAKSRANEVAVAARARRDGAYGVLRGSLDWLAKQPGRRSIVMVSGGYASDKDDRGMREIVNRSLQAKAPIHFLDARGLQGMSRYLGAEYREALEHDGMEAALSFSEEAAGASGLAADTGGLYVRNTNDMEKGLARIIDMTTTYYVLGYEPPANRRAGFRKIKVELAKKKDMKVVARRGYFVDDVPPR